MPREVFESLRNDSLGTATNLGRVEEDPFTNGSLTGSDTFDVYKFRVDRPTKLTAFLFPTGVDADLSLINSQGQTIKFSATRGTSANEVINSDNLPVGDYFLSVNKVSGGGTYILGTNGAAISRAQLSVTVDRVTARERFDTPIPFTRQGEADFVINIGGKKSKKFEDRNDIRPNFTFTNDVNINSLLPGSFISVNEDDGSTFGNIVNLDDRADINPNKGQGSAPLTFDVIKGEVFSSNPSFRVREGEVVTLQGDGDDGSSELADSFVGKARIQFRANYDTFTSSTSSFRNNTPVIRGTNARQILTGKNLGGILCGEGGNDNLSGMGGNDVICGGTGNDKLNGGTGNDISFGGKGRDTHIGGTGKDTFVLALNSGVDVTKDFQNGTDKLGLSMELNPEVLDIVQQGKNTVIGVGNERLAILSNVKANQITAADFVTVDFTQFKGMEVPTLVA